jgi:predicted nucleotidyltransferase
MKSQDVIDILRRHADTLRERGVKHAALFGSVAREEAGPESDIDIMIELAPEAKVDLFAYVELRDYIADLFPGSVDVVNKRALKADLRPSTDADAIYAF